jgi:GWxTD domain-containing protein
LAIGLIAMPAIVAVAQEEMAAGAGEAKAAVDYLNWDQGPAGFLMTKDDQKAWKDIGSEADAKRFIELFWAKRNPDPAQPFNTFKAQFESRVRYADDNFSWEGRRGALTDRGRVLIVMGPPHQAENRSPTQTVETMDDLSSGTDEVRANAAMWVYDPGRLPKELKIKGSRLLFVFYEEKPESNNFTLDRSHREATMGMRALTKVPDAYVLHPKLTQVPKPVAVPGAQVASAAHLDWLDVGPGPLNEQVVMMGTPGVADAGHRPWWVHVALPSDAPRLDLFAGRVKTVDGEVLSTFEKEVVPIEYGNHAAYHITFPLAVGDYVIEAVGAAGGEPQVLYSETVTVPEAPAEGTWLSDIMVGLYAEKKDDAMLGSAFCLGRLHVMPLSGPDMTRKDEISIFGFVLRPELDEAGKVALNTKIELRRDGRRMGRPLELPIEAVQVADEVYVYTNGINLGALPEPGEYQLTFGVTDPTSELSVERVVDINVTE